MRPDTWGAALFDLDGTLVDSEPASQAAYRAYFAARGWDVAPDVVHKFAGRRATDVFAQLPGPWSGEEPLTLLNGVIGHFDHEANPPVPVPGAAALVRALHGLGVPIALVTSSRRWWAERMLDEVLDVRACFTALVTAEDTPTGKPDPAPYRAAAVALDVDPATAVVLEDTVAGIYAALGAGIGHVIGVSTSVDPDVLLDAGAHRVVPNLAELT